MKVLVIGGGGREHALCWKLKQSPSVEKIFCIPGNAGIAEIAECADIDSANLAKLADFAEKKGVNLTVAGPEVPLCDGITDLFRSRGLKVFGPDKSAARLEGSKTFAKEFMLKHGIPTAASKTFFSEEKAIKHLNAVFSRGEPGIVVKADGVAAGKGVTVAISQEEALDAVKQCFAGTFGDAGRTVVIEELLKGEEASILALTDGETMIPLASSQDHKRVGDGDTGPNTGGMGAYSPAPVVTPEIMAIVNEKVLDPFLKGLRKEKLYYRGIIYAGIMIDGKDVKVLEFNVRFGDPETQAVLMRLESDFAEVALKTAEGLLKDVRLEWSDAAAVCVVMASGGYPGSYKKGFEISGIEEAESEGAVVFHAGTSIKDGKTVNSGGRVLGVTARGPGIKKAIEKAYLAVGRIRWEGASFRKDIGHRALKF